MRNLKNALFLISALMFSAQGLCQTETALTIDVKRLGDRIAVFRVEGGNANITALNSQKGIVVIDTDGSPVLASRLRRKMTEVFGSERFAYVINTHSHGDHTFGNQVFADAVIVGHENCRSEMAQSAERIKGTMAGLKAGLAQMQGSLEKLEQGSEQARGMSRRIAYYESLLKGYENDFVLTPPSLSFNDGLTLDLGDLTLELMYFGTSHSASDIVVHCPQEGLWLTGDLFHPKADLYVDSERVLQLPRWKDVLERITGTEQETKHIVPGHGDYLDGDQLKKKLADVQAKQAEFAGKESAFFVFRKAFEEQGFEASLRTLRDLRAAPERYYTLHPELDQFAFRLMLKDRLDEALSIFSALAELFPDSYLAFDSLGEVYLRKGDGERAVQNFKKSLEINPENENAAKQLRSLQKKQEM